MSTFTVSSPPGNGWERTAQGRDSIWFHRSASVGEFSMIGVVGTEDIPRDYWAMEDESLAKAVIRDYRQSTLDSGHAFNGERFETVEIGGKRFFADAAFLSAIHGMPVAPDITAHELVYIFIGPREPQTQPYLYSFMFKDFHRKGVDFEDHLAQFVSVLESFRPKDRRNPA